MRRLKRALRRRPLRRWLWPALAVAALSLPTGALGYGVGGAVGSWAGIVPGVRIADRLLELSADAGLRVKVVYGEGLARTERDELAAEAGIAAGQPILAVDLDAVRARVEQLPWVRSAAVTRSLPDTITIRVVERRPLALWQRGDDYRLIDGRGDVIMVDNVGLFRNLPVIAGEKAPSRVVELFALASSAPDLLPRVRAATLVGGRRWDIELDTGVRVRLPEHGAEAAWRLAATRLREARLLEAPTAVIDLRLPDRMVVRQRPGDQEVRPRSVREERA